METGSPRPRAIATVGGTTSCGRGTPPKRRCCVGEATMTTTELAPSIAEVTNRARAVAARLPARAADIEAARRLPADLLSDLLTAGTFRILLPQSHGGS